MICLIGEALISVLFLCNIINHLVYAALVMAIPVLAALFEWAYFRFGWFKFYFHDILGWHVSADCDPIIAEDGQIHMACEYCDEDFVDDGHQDWYCGDDE